MKTLLCSIASFVFTTALLADDIDLNNAVKEIKPDQKFDYSHELSENLDLSISNTIGRIEVVPSNSKAVRLSGQYNGGKKNAKLKVNTEGRSLKISVEYPGDSNGNGANSIVISGDSSNVVIVNGKVISGGQQNGSDSGAVNMRIEIPTVFCNDLEVNEVSGDIVVKDIKANTTGRRSINLINTSGDTSLKDCSGTIDIKSTSGDIKTENTDSDLSLNDTSGSIVSKNNLGNVSAKAISGDIRISGAKARVDASTISGDIKLSNPESTSEHTSSVSGDVTRSK